jgi:hypothetical protein
MAVLTLQNINDIARTRNMMRKLLIAQKCSPTLATRSWLAVTVITETFLATGNSIFLDVGVKVQIEPRRVVELCCEIGVSGEQHHSLVDVENMLTRAVDVVKISNKQRQVHIEMQLW